MQTYIFTQILLTHMKWLHTHVTNRILNRLVHKYKIYEERQILHQVAQKRSNIKTINWKKINSTMKIIISKTPTSIITVQ